jgi:hypothetical protein
MWKLNLCTIIISLVITIKVQSGDGYQYHDIHTKFFEKYPLVPNVVKGDA